nr:polysaccharide deacetylase family protein [Candidatus Saccharibacteria bacterium]
YLSDPYYMTPEMITDLGRSGHEIGSHGMLHTSLVQSSPSQLMSELTTSRDALTNITGFMPTDFASPFGEYNAESLAAIQQYYSSHRSVNTGFNSRENFERYAIKVQNVTSATTTLELSTWVTQANQQRTWLVLVYHAVDPSTANDPDYNTTPTELGSHLEVIRNSGITVSTVNQALAEITPQL